MTDPSPLASAAGAGSSPLSPLQRGALGAAGVLVAWWLVHRPRSMGELAVAGACAVLGVGRSGRSLIDRAGWLVGFVTRGRWSQLTVDLGEATCVRVGSREASVSVRRLDHRGRLDLSGRDESVLRELVNFVERVAAHDGERIVTWSLRDDGDACRTLLAGPSGVAAPWRAGDRADLAAWCGHDETGSSWIYERWSYLRTASGVTAVCAVRSSRAEPARAVLGDLVPFGSSRQVVVRLRVDSPGVARRRAERQSHRWRATLAMASRAGFARRARFDLASGELDDRERSVAGGRALARADVFVVLRARSVSELDGEMASLRRDAASAGLTLERGDGRHARWWRAALPGSPGDRSDW